MSATLKTENFELPIFAPQDYTSWLSYNQAMELIDSALETNKNEISDLQTGQGSSSAAISQITDSIDTINQTLTNQNKSLDALTTRVENNESHDNDRDLLITEIQNDIQDNTTKINENTTSVQNINNQISETNNKISTLNQQVNTNKNDITNLENQIQSLPNQFYYLDDIKYLNNIEKNKVNITGYSSSLDLTNINSTLNGSIFYSMYKLGNNKQNIMRRVEGNIAIHCKILSTSYNVINVSFTDYPIETNSVGYGTCQFISSEYTNPAPVSQIYIANAAKAFIVPLMFGNLSVNDYTDLRINFVIITPIQS